MSATRLVPMTEMPAAAIWIAHCRLKASAAQNIAVSGDAEGDDDWAEELLDLCVAYDAAPVDTEETVTQTLSGYLSMGDSYPAAEEVLSALRFYDRSAP